MQIKIRTILVLLFGLAVLAAVAITLFASLRPKLCVRAFRNEPSFNALSLLPLTAESEDEWKRLIEDARLDSDAARRLLNEIRSQYSKEGVEIRKSEAGLYCRRCQKGPALVYHLDEEGYGYFAFVRIDGDTEAELDKRENGFPLIRMHDTPPARN